MSSTNLSVSALLLLTLNIDGSGQLLNEMPQIDHEARVSHSRELVDETPRLSAVSKLEQSIEGLVVSRLKPEFKTQARALAQAIIEEANSLKMDPVFFLAIIQTESKFNPLAIGRFGEIGLMQIKPSTARWIAKENGLEWNGKESLKDMRVNVKLGGAYLKMLRGRFAKRGRHYLAAYNMGAARLKSRLAKSSTLGQPRLVYAENVLKNYRSIYRSLEDAQVAASLASLASQNAGVQPVTAVAAVSPSVPLLQ